ncbi:DUF58 domain-containing protein [Halobacteria archaeon AArc-m2/3/4]|uniref:DUF58 domain-containing protein n=1 Tax=Natronoglomus mannanivorans TaxID=2979990 RepID=A0ABT2QJ90_9EURY|nr:DUF58 domain-containing protein [Halobacteria archaeon AArc-m2/3/4]
MFRRSLRWRVAVGASFLLAAAGIVLVTPELVIAAMAPIGYVAYSALTSAPVVADTLSITRTVSETQPSPGGVVDVRLTIENNGDQPIPKLRLVDGVPADLSVVDGSPRAALSLRAGESVSIEYRLRARYGEFTFDPVTVRTQSLSAGSVYTTTIEAAGPETVTATLDPADSPQGQGGGSTSGEMLIEQGNDGLEFFGIRGYEPTDPVHRVNWRRYAKDGELTTIDYRNREVSDVLVVIDARESAGVARNQHSPTGTELSVYVANEIVTSTRNYRTPIGVAALGVDGFDDNDGIAWVVPGTGREELTRLRSLLDAAAATVRPDADSGRATVPAESMLTLFDQLRPGTHVVFLSPVLDEHAVETVRRFRSAGYTVSMCTPDVTARSNPGAQVTATRRDLSLAELRQLGVPIIDWQPDDPLAESLRQALRSTNAAMGET